MKTIIDNLNSIINCFIVFAGVVFICYAIWHGWSFEIGKPDEENYLRVHQLPLKRFFK